jgi:3-oxoacyl-[acyl-carrier protein] reductase
MRVSIITGGGSGIGAAVARRLAAGNQCLMLHGQGADAAGLERLEAVAAGCRRAGAAVACCAGDLAEAGTASELVRAARASFGAVDAIVHAAGFADRRDFATLPRSGLQRSFAVMAAAFHEMVVAALPDLTRGPQGRVVAVSSFVAHRFAPGATFPASAAAKAALEALVRCLAIELASSGRRPISSCRATRARMPGDLERWTRRAGGWPRRPIRSDDWPNPRRWPRSSPFYYRMTPGM